MTKEQKIKEILERGVEDVIVKEHLEGALLSGKKLRVKFGIDPTGPKIHLGRAIPLRKLKAFQDLGHKIVLIIGDFTATIGDPSDKLSKRPMLTTKAIQENMKDYAKQLGKILDMKKVELHYNSEWLEGLNFREISQLAECFSIQQMTARRNFKDRIDRGEDVSMREMLYPLVQGYDSVAVKADVEVGGFDQLFNVKAGRIIQKQYGQSEQDILTTQMLEGNDGRKMSTSWGNIITMVDEPSDMFGKIMAVRDDLILKYFWLCTEVSQDDVDMYQKRLEQGANPRDIKMELGKKIVTLYHSEKDAQKAQETFESVFSKKETPTDMPTHKPSKNPITLPELLVEVKFCSSKGEAKRLVEQGGVDINGREEKDWRKAITFNGQEVIQAGKRKFVKISV